MCLATCRFCPRAHTYRLNAAELHLSGRWLSGSPIIRLDLALRVNFFENSTKITCLVITGYQVRYSAVFELLELEIRRDRKDQAQVRTVNSNCRTSNCKSSLFSKKNPIIRIFCISGWLAVPINPDKWSSTAVVH